MDEKVVYVDVGKLTYGQAIEKIAEWWELIRSDGVNIAAEVQKARERLRAEQETETETDDKIM
jgi:hypothetical protein